MEKNDYFSSYSVVSAKPQKNDVKATKNKKKKNGGDEENGDKNCCKCLSAKTRKNTKNFFTGLATNLGICVLLFGYTLIGSVIFLTIEGGSVYQYQQILATRTNDKNVTSSTKIFAKNEKARAKTVENIWDITYSLNILYRDNWTRLAAIEITRFQDELLKNMAQETKMLKRRESLTKNGDDDVTNEWTFAKAFLYSLTVLTTIGYGNTAPHTSLGKIVTMIYALFGIPLTLLYLSSIGAILSRVARGVFSRALCCCLCSNCGYCCYDEKKMQEKERRKKRKRQQMELLAHQQQQQLQEPYYILRNNVDNADSDTESAQISVHGCSILAPILLCLCAMFLYICFGTFFLYKFQRWNLLDGFYFCFMSLTTISFPYFQRENVTDSDSAIFWFCSIYIMSGMALTAMCFNVVHDEIIGRLRRGVSGTVLPRDVVVTS